MEHRDARQQESVGERDQRVIEIRIRLISERDDREVRDPGDSGPEGGFRRRRYFVWGDFFWPFSSYS
jgi:hypothetical protein